MYAYKVLVDGRSPFTGWAWPSVASDGPGDWIQVEGPLQACVNGIHACTPAHLPIWLGSELWAVELDGKIVELEDVLVASRARLLERITSWDRSMQIAFGEACAERARSVVRRWPEGASLLAEVEDFSRQPDVSEAGYWSAVIAGESEAGIRSGPVYEAGFREERQAQADWLRAELALSG